MYVNAPRNHIEVKHLLFDRSRTTITKNIPTILTVCGSSPQGPQVVGMREKEQESRERCHEVPVEA